MVVDGIETQSSSVSENPLDSSPPHDGELSRE